MDFEERFDKLMDELTTMRDRWVTAGYEEASVVELDEVIQQNTK